MKKWIAPTLTLLALIGLAVSAQWWVSKFLEFIKINGNLIQGLADFVQLVLWSITGVIALVSVLRLQRRSRRKTRNPSTNMNTHGPLNSDGIKLFVSLLDATQVIAGPIQRRALIEQIGRDPNRFSFINEVGAHDFAVSLINALNRGNDLNALQKLLDVIYEELPGRQDEVLQIRSMLGLV